MSLRLLVGAIFSRFNGAVLLAVDDIFVDSEMPEVTSLMSRVIGSVFEDGHMDRVCVRTFIRVSVYAL
jgi:hypothetical protein